MLGGEKLIDGSESYKSCFFLFFFTLFFCYALLRGGFFIDEEEITNKPEIRRIMAKKLWLSSIYIVSKNCRF